MAGKGGGSSERYHLLVAILLVGIIAFDVGLFVWRKVPRGVDVDTSQVRDFDLKLDPNTASSEALSAIKGLSRSQAEQIVKYRELHGGKTCFGKYEDLKSVKGIGPKTVEKIAGKLQFRPEDAN